MYSEPLKNTLIADVLEAGQRFSVPAAGLLLDVRPSGFTAEGKTGLSSCQCESQTRLQLSPH